MGCLWRSCRELLLITYMPFLSWIFFYGSFLLYRFKVLSLSLSLNQHKTKRFAGLIKTLSCLSWVCSESQMVPWLVHDQQNDSVSSSGFAEVPFQHFTSQCGNISISHGAAARMGRIQVQNLTWAFLFPMPGQLAARKQLEGYKSAIGQR